ncbi:hypothetical protein [Sphingobium sp. MK2]|uniref:hypothetical protein n=1 Tax=Sphingobium sp. MK2 TaxID=3116540 RepID=UPI0032E36770
MKGELLSPAFGVPLQEPAFSDDRWVSPLNWLPEVRDQMVFPERLLIHDVTLRDGEQTPRVAFTPDEKIAIAVELDRLGAHSIEPGLPVTEPDIEVLRALSAMGLRAAIVPLVRINESDVRASIDAKADGMLLEFSLNPYFMRDVYQTTPDDLLLRIAEYAQAGKEAGMYVEFMGWDAMRIEGLDFQERFFRKLAETAPLDRVTIADTFGMGHPFATYHYIRKLRDWTGLPVGFHIHNDFGLAAAGAIMAVSAGADMVHSSINGLGERSGNVATEEIAMIAQHLLGLDAGIDLARLKSTSDMVAEISKIRLASNKAIVGDGLFEVESGIAVHAMQAMKDTPLKNLIFPFQPQTVGQDACRIVLGVGTGGASTASILEGIGVEASRDEIRELTGRFKQAGRVLKNGVPESMVRQIVNDVVGKA